MFTSVDCDRTMGNDLKLRKGRFYLKNDLMMYKYRCVCLHSFLQPIFSAFFLGQHFLTSV